MLVERLHFLLEVLYPLRSVRENVIERKLEGIALGVGCYSPKELDNLIRVNEGKRTDLHHRNQLSMMEGQSSPGSRRRFVSLQ